VPGPDRHGDDLAHLRVLREQRRHLGEVDPVAPNLELVVLPPPKLEPAGRQQRGPVPGAVHAGAGHERVRHEPLLGQRRVADVPAGEPVAADVEIADLADRQRTQRPVQHIGRRAGHRRPDRHRRAAPVPAGQRERGADHTVLRRAVAVDDLEAGAQLPHPRRVRHRHHRAGTRPCAARTPPRRRRAARTRSPASTGRTSGSCAPGTRRPPGGAPVRRAGTARSVPRAAPRRPSARRSSRT